MKGLFQIMELGIRHSALRPPPGLVGIDESIPSPNNDEDRHLQAAEICIWDKRNRNRPWADFRMNAGDELHQRSRPVWSSCPAPHGFRACGCPHAIEDRAAGRLPFPCPAAQCRVIRNGEIQSHQPQHRCQKAFGLPQSQAEQQAKREGGLDRKIGIAWLPTSRCPLRSAPRRYAFRDYPQRQTAASAKTCLVLRPVCQLELHLADAVTASGIVFERHSTRDQLLRLPLTTPTPLMIRAPRSSVTFNVRTFANIAPAMYRVLS